MKKNLFSTALLAVMALGLLGGCDNSSAGGGGNLTEDQVNQYLTAALDTPTICFINGDGTTLSQTEAANWAGDDFNVIRAAKTMSIRVRDISSDRLNVTLTWSYPEESATYVHAVTDVGDTEGAATHQLIEFDYYNIPADQTIAFPLTVTASLDGYTYTSSRVYNFNLTACTYTYPEMTLEQFYARGTDGRYTWCDQTNATIEGYEHYIVSVKGYVVGYAPDGNFAIIASGNRYVQLYAGSAMDLMPSSRPALTVGNLVEVRGQVDVYYGNVQIAFIHTVWDAGEDSSIAQPSGEWAITETEWEALHQYDGNHSRAVTISGEYAGDLRDQSGNRIDSFTAGARCSFKMTVGGETITVAYNYHVNRNNTGIGDEYAEIIDSLPNGADIKVSGFMLVNDGDDASWPTPAADGYTYNSDGDKITYEIMPFDSGDIEIL